MSNNHYRYGQYPGQQTQPPFAQSSTLNSTSYYGNYQQPNDPAGNYAAVNNSYQYNANNIPGLGMSASLPPTPYPAENNAAWHSQPQATQRHDFMQVQKTTPKSGQANPRENASSAAASSQKQTDSVLEEGELSEGDYEDLYEPKDSLTTVPIPQIPSGSEHRDGSPGDADESSIYDGATPQGEAITNSTSTSIPAAEREYSPGGDWEPAYQERERSGSYSPYLSPREIQRKASVSKPPSHGAKQAQVAQATIQSLPGIDMAPTQQSQTAVPLSNGKHYPKVATNGSSVGIEPSAPAKDAGSPLAFRSVAEAKKKAQEAILGLWPLKVRYQDYIEEGINEKTIKGLFSELGLEASLPKSAQPKKVISDSQIQASSTSGPPKILSETQNIQDEPSTTKSKQPPTTESTSAPKMGDAKTAAKSAAEERKDKIARKLAAKAQKPVVTTQPPVSAPPSKPIPAQPAQTKPTPGDPSVVTPAIASSAKSKTRAENNAILHQKLAALKKAQEERVTADKKLAIDTATKPPTPAVASTSGSTTNTGPKGLIEPSTNSPVITLPLAETTRRSASTENSISREVGIPGLSLSIQPVQPTNRNLKRPVASDFDSYPTPSGILKRTRTQDTLIIDVSDDEDVEMDMGSPIDEPSSASEINLPQRSLGAFPPLPDSLDWKQRSSPSSSVALPKPNGTKLDLLTKRIEEARRKIAEAEAKKAATKPNAVQSSRSQSQASTVGSPIQTQSLEIVKARDEARKVGAQRRERIVSYELPTVDATLKEKQEMLKEAVARAAQLKLEIQASMEERDKLTTEAEQLAKSQEPTPNTVSAQAQPVQSVEPPASSTHVSESQVSTAHAPGMNPTTDVSMVEAGELVEQDQGAASSDARLHPYSVQSNSMTSSEPLAATSRWQESHVPDDEGLRAESSIDISVSESISTDSIVENSGIEPSTTTTASVAQHAAQDLPEPNGSVPSPRKDPTPSNEEPYSPEAVLAPPIQNFPFPGQKSGPIIPSLRQDESVSLAGESPTRSVLTETGPAEPAQVPSSSALTDLNGQVQNSSSHEHPLLTETQDEAEQAPLTEDLLSYHSPLAYFRAYRFHPSYFNKVAGGLKSMTYSSRIDPMRPLCPYVLSGEQCPAGGSCEFQHFDSMILPDGEIITQLGSSDMFTGETRNRFIEGLKKVLNELKANKVRDFDRITKAIVKHRQEFLEDKSKVLPLDTGIS
ncbi:hypothetical protein GGR53DRAFT_487493 [Hypoxylon sp. FL1150]|nr:hypothetical protein GGR53DRAFT_487493 [Hypoxylon sp. FL1150]